MKRQFLLSNRQSPWIITAVLLLILLLFLGIGRWRATSTGPQVQVPMFYDAHYLYPRPWTQAQEAPGVPAPFPLAFYGDNTLSQSFISGADELSMVEVWLQGPPDGRVTLTLSDDTGPLYTGVVDFPERPSGGPVRFAFPTIHAAEGRAFQLTLAAPDATADEPAITHAIGGDRLGGPLQVNEYRRPGNLELRTYVRGTAVLDALTEQLLPDLFRLRLQQFKVFKGETFAVLLALTMGLSGVFLVLARPDGQSLGRAVGWTLAGLLLALLVWQVGWGRVQLPLLDRAVAMTAATADTAVSPTAVSATTPRLVNDLTAALWTAERLPEKRFVSTTVAAGYPAIVVPAESALEYALDVPLNGRLRAGVQVDGEGSLAFDVAFNGATLAHTAVSAADGPIWLDVDLTDWQGQGGILRLATEPLSGAPDGLWLRPQLLAQTDWLLAELPVTAVPAGHRFGADVVLLGYTVEPSQPQPGDLVTVTLYWQGERPLTQNATAFVHALNDSGEMVAQSDSQPVRGTYPLTIWPPGAIIADAHTFNWPTGSGNLAQLAVGLYDPSTQTRWPVTNLDGVLDPNGQAELPIKE
ncbi:MAG: hypothetical protein KBE23_14920 [Chloroflexi bacterium]|nr:hypothetical protein [Chloroflexota bacterium]MBP7044037.1 hypothetical protein [Chloroflexota bacterium]